ncbi:MAG: hypothetical protein E6Q24_15395 [Chitinophagaceae bacterium]|nr:MAG: hypothetical protein E6Q24_15395 [Chitinophagaceae bacterium]
MGTDGNNLMKRPPHLWWVWGNIWLGGIQEIKAGLISSLPKREKMLLVVIDKNKAPRLRGLLLYKFPFLLIAAVSHASGKKKNRGSLVANISKTIKKCTYKDIFIFPVMRSLPSSKN